ncbi:LacI family DNA-binding transcriptional regulator [Nocardioides sp. Kera G14]|uniref:LacI family DNA-binding transcriptional regulator n=1 Tax=Nocardioides sp. Kera G14 TaxID=2884264 RepID=UPI001D107A03|nr:LacI family DNA-binding transcriptional regulator [Nocardioides sp. Kera G14]UDY22957.1 LacI family transcriptional regulator [Nocardioides sp. Kera G14]
MTVRRATIQDVARKAGVSATTVSHTFSGNGFVATATQKRVREAASALGYRPDALARGLRSSRFGAVALVERSLMADVTRWVLGVDYFLRFAGAAALAAVDQGFALMFVADPSDNAAPSAALACDGFLLTEPLEDDPLLAMLDHHGIPYVTVGRDPGRSHDASSGVADATVVDIATELITMRAVEHLLDGGATRVAIMVGTHRDAWTLDSEFHYRAWAEGRGEEPIVLQQPEEDGVAAGHRAAAELLAHHPEVDAVYVLTADHAVGLQEALRAHGRDDVLLLGGSDSAVLRSADPPISAVDLQPEALAWEAVMRLLNLIDGGDRSAPTPEHGQILVRGRASRPEEDGPESPGAR